MNEITLNYNDIIPSNKRNSLTILSNPRNYRYLDLLRGCIGLNIYQMSDKLFLSYGAIYKIVKSFEELGVIKLEKRDHITDREDGESIIRPRYHLVSVVDKIILEM